MDLRIEQYHDGVYRDLEFPPPPGGRPYVYSNMVGSMDGKAVVEGTEKGLGSKTDQRLMRRLRAHADMVLTGAGTFRASGAGARVDDEAMREWRVALGKPANPIAAVITGSGGLDTSRQFFTAQDYDAVVFAGPGVPDEDRSQMAATGRRVIGVSGGSGGLPETLATARSELGVDRLLVEGGPGLLAAFLRLGALDEFFQTISGRIVGGADTLTIVEGERFGAGKLPEFRLVSVIVNGTEDELYLRWRRKGP